MSVNQVNGFNQSFRGERKERGTSPLIPAILVGGATTAGLKYIGPKHEMTIDEFIKADKSKLDLTEDEKALVAKIPAEETKTEGADTAKTTASTADDQAKEFEKLTKDANKNIEYSNATYEKLGKQLSAEQKMSQKIQDVYNKIESFTKQKEIVMDEKEEAKLTQKSKSLDDEIKLINKKLDDPKSKLDETQKEAMKKTKEAKAQELEEVNSKLFEHDKLKADYVEKLKIEAEKASEEAEKETKKSAEALKKANDETKEADKTHKAAKKELEDANKANPKKTDAEIKTLEEKVSKAEAELEKKQLEKFKTSLEHEIKKSESKFAEKLAKTLDIKDDKARTTELANLHEQQIKIASVDGKAGDAVEALKTGKQNAQLAFNYSEELKENKTKFLDRNAKFEASLGERAAANSTTDAIKEGGEVIKKEISQEGKAAYEALSKAGKLKTNMSWGKAGLWGGAAALGTLIIAAMAGGKKEEA